MKVQYIKDGRFPHAIWVDKVPTLAVYPQYQALDIFTALDLWKGLTDALVQAGQGGTLHTGLKEALQ